MIATKSRSETPAETATKTIAVLTIGQSPRPDRLSEEIQTVVGPGLRVLERGALDALSPTEIADLAPGANDYQLITLLRDGVTARLSKKRILHRLQEQIIDLEDREGVAATLLMCTGEFPAFTHRMPLVLPQAALYGVVIGLAAGERIASLTPLESQLDQARQKWHEMGVTDVGIFAANPYLDVPLATVAAASARARAAGARILFMDCFGFDLAMKRAAQCAFGGPVILARSLAARLLAEIIE